MADLCFEPWEEVETAERKIERVRRKEGCEACDGSEARERGLQFKLAQNLSPRGSNHRLIRLWHLKRNEGNKMKNFIGN